MRDRPFDVQAVVIQWVHLISGDGWESQRSTLNACALVCRAWTPLAQRFLFRWIPYIPRGSLPTRHILTTILAAVQNKPHLGTYVHALHILPGLADDDYYALMRLCPHIAIISVQDTFRTPHDFGARLSATGIRPQTLRARGECGNVAALVASWPSVRFLDVAGHLSRGSSWPVLKLPYGLRVA